MFIDEFTTTFMSLKKFENRSTCFGVIASDVIIMALLNNQLIEIGLPEVCCFDLAYSEKLR